MRPSEQGSKPRSFTRVEPPASLSRPPSQAPAGGEGEQRERREKRGGGARSADPGAPQLRAPRSHRQPSELGSSARPPTRAGGGSPERASPLPSPSPAGSNKGDPARGRVQAAPRTEREWGARPARERAGPGRGRPGSARLPGVTGVPVDSVAEAGAPSQRGAEERGPEDSPQQGQQPHRPRGPLWSGPAGPGPLRCRGEKGTKWRWGGGGAELGVGCRHSQATPPGNFPPMGAHPRLPTRRGNSC